jgi:2-methylcitrate dehydratase PrpD
MTETVAAAFADFAVRCRHQLPAAVGADVIGRITDVIGNSLAACELPDPAEPHYAVGRVLDTQGGKPESTPLLGTSMLPAASAALVNGTLAHALDFDDTHLPSVLHPSSCVVPAAMAVAEAQGSSGPELMSAIAAGIEICNRVGMAAYVPDTRNSAFFVRGLHATSICGTVGAAAAAAVLYGLDADGIMSALAIAASMGAGILEANRTGGSVKRIHCGWAAHAGVSAAAFAAAGVTGPATVFEGGFGFFQAYLGTSYTLDALTAGLGERWELLRTVYKPYPSNHFTHPVIDCALAIRATGIDVAAIADIEVGVAATVIRTIGEPPELKARPSSPYHAKFSAPYVCGAALFGGGGLGVYLDDFDEHAFHDPRRVALAEKVRVVPDEICDADFPQAFGAIVTARLDDGSTVAHRVRSSRGGPENPLSAEDLDRKFTLNAGRVLAPDEIARLSARIRALPNAPRVGPLLDVPLVPPPMPSRPPAATASAPSGLLACSPSGAEEGV